MLDASGAFDAAKGFTLPSVTVFAANEKSPTSKLELLARTISALNTAIRADGGALAKMNGLEIEATLHDGSWKAATIESRRLKKMKGKGSNGSR